jgi:predicted DNA-binding antitoxin AbrB/MazE fold protein
MTRTIHAVFENGVFRPLHKVDLPEQTAVEFEPRVLGQTLHRGPGMSEGLAKIYAILGERYASGHEDTAESHSEPE